MPQNVGYSAAFAAADALFSPRGREQASDVLSPDTSLAVLETGLPVPEMPPAGELQAFRSAPPKADNGGRRILQAIEYAAPAAPAVNETLRRQTRKPNAKRKARRSDIGEMPIVAVSEPSLRDEAQAVDAASDGAVTPSRANAEQAGPLTLVRRRSERFSWVRKTLRPGEKWKRRLPKVAW